MEPGQRSPGQWKLGPSSYTQAFSALFDQAPISSTTTPMFRVSHQRACAPTVRPTRARNGAVDGVFQVVTRILLGEDIVQDSATISSRPMDGLRRDRVPCRCRPSHRVLRDKDVPAAGLREHHTPATRRTEWLGGEGALPGQPAGKVSYGIQSASITWPGQDSRSRKAAPPSQIVILPLFPWTRYPFARRNVLVKCATVNHGSEGRTVNTSPPRQVPAPSSTLFFARNASTIFNAASTSSVRPRATGAETFPMAISTRSDASIGPPSGSSHRSSSVASSVLNTMMSRAASPQMLI